MYSCILDKAVNKSKPVSEILYMEHDNRIHSTSSRAKCQIEPVNVTDDLTDLSTSLPVKNKSYNGNDGYTYSFYVNKIQWTYLNSASWHTRLKRLGKSFNTKSTSTTFATALLQSSASLAYFINLSI